MSDNEKNKYEKADDVLDIAKEIVKNDSSFNYVIIDKIVFLRKNGNSRKCIANISGIHGKLAPITDAKYIITVISDRFDNLPFDIKKKVIEHELMHISKDFDGGMYSHDVQDFAYMLMKHGINWQSVSEDGKTSFAIPMNEDGKFEKKI